MNLTKTIGPLLIAASLVISSTASASPRPYERGHSSIAKVQKITNNVDNLKNSKKRIHADLGTPVPTRTLSMVPVTGSDGTNALCRSGSKAARWAC